jgi:hypothetical protein
MVTLLLKETQYNTVYLTSITAAQKDLLYAAKKEDSINKNDNALTELSYSLGIYCPAITKVGKVEQNTSGGLTEDIDFFKGKDTSGLSRVGYNRELHYRDYSRPPQVQKNMAWLINMCEGSLESAKSAFKQMDEEYCCLWVVPNDSPANKEMLELLGEEKWKVKH